MKQSNLKNIPINIRPRAKAIKEGVQKLSLIELLTILIGHGTMSNSALDIAINILKKFHSLININFATIDQLKTIPGLGNSKAILIQAVFEIHQRLNKENKIYSNFKNINNLIKFAVEKIGHNLRESLLLVTLDNDDNIKYWNIIYTGTKKYISIDPREIITNVLKTDSSKFYCFHNHPSGVVTPSQEDEKFTLNLNEFSNIMGLKLLGHYVVTQKGNFEIIKIM